VEVGVDVRLPSEAGATASLEALSEAISDFSVMQQAAFEATKMANDRASAAAGTALANVSALTAEVEEASKRLSAALDGFATDLTRSVEAIETTRRLLDRHERDAGLFASAAAQSASAAAASASAAAESAMHVDRASRPKPTGGLFSGWSR
jgi:hypothetical protein